MKNIGVNLRVTSYCNQGGRKSMEDMFAVAYQRTVDKKDLAYTFFGIFDGHGGPEAAAFVKKNLLNTITNYDTFWSKNDHDVLEAIHKGYISTHDAMRKNLGNWPKTTYDSSSVSGTTASIAFIMRGKIYTGHVGDSRIVLGYQNKENGEWKAKQLTKDHKPESSEEKNRIEKCGGKVVNKSGVHRVVWKRSIIDHKGPIGCSTTVVEVPFLAISRSLGDFWSFNFENNKYIVSPEPDVKVFNIDISKHRCLIFGTDGVWNVLSSAVAISNVYETEKLNIKIKEKQDWLNPSKNLIDKTVFNWSNVKRRADNSTVITVLLDSPCPPAPQVLFQHQIQTCNMKCGNINNCRCFNGDPQVQNLGSGSTGGYAFFTRYHSNHTKASTALAST